jgi:hypothetical protein
MALVNYSLSDDELSDGHLPAADTSAEVSDEFIEEDAAPTATYEHDETFGSANLFDEWRGGQKTWSS